jgi:tetratricopeptide (TPR) repeat protein
MALLSEISMRLLTFLFLSSSLYASLPKPSGLNVSNSASSQLIRWQASEGAAYYRVAVFASPDEEGKRELMGAVWVRGLSWTYGAKGSLAKVGKMPSTPCKTLALGAEYKVMIRAADESGSQLSDWISTEFKAGASGQTPSRKTVALSPSPSPSMTSTPMADAKSATGPAELEVDLAAEFKETPQADETGLTSTVKFGAVTPEAARLLLQAGKADDAEQAYKKLLEKDPANADLWEGLGDSYDARLMKIEAKESYEKALAIDGKRERLLKWMQENLKH